MLTLLVFSGNVGAEPAQENLPTATPVQVNLPTPLPIIPTDSQDTTDTISSTTRTPTPEGSALLEAITEANVRSQPDPESDRLGTIRAGDIYTVVGRYFKWYEFQYNQSPNGIGWVFDELVNITGNTDSIPDLTLGTPTPGVSAQQASSTLVVLTQTPGGILTATAGVGAIPLPIESSVGRNATAADLPGLPNLTGGGPTSLPTFTPPPNLASVSLTIQLSDESAVGGVSTDIPKSSDVITPSRIPPILPILVLGGIGILGLIISSIRK